MTFEEYYRRELDMSDCGVEITTELYDILKETFEAGQKSCARVHTDNADRLDELKTLIEEELK